jgi:hypothetical protein
MSGFVHNLKQKPQDVRNRIAIISAMSITLIIVGIWLLVVRNGKTDEDVVERSAREDLKPLMMIFGGAKENFQDVKENINSAKKDNQ